MVVPWAFPCPNVNTRLNASLVLTLTSFSHYPIIFFRIYNVRIPDLFVTLTSGILLYIYLSNTILGPRNPSKMVRETCESTTLTTTI